MVFFEDGSPNKDIHEALREAERVRKRLKEEEIEYVANRAAAASVEQADDADPAAPSISRRRIERRSLSVGRVR
jgi:hypothetical protein